MPGDITARIYTDNEITGQVVRVINEAKEQLAIVSPYIDRVPHVEQAILRAKGSGARVIVFARQDGNTIGGNGASDALGWFRSNDVEVVGVPFLHAKFYMNEREAVVTSMNLLKSSWSGSLELGFLVDGAAHKQLVDYLQHTLRVVSGAPVSGESATGSWRTPEKKQPGGGRSPAKRNGAEGSGKGFFGTFVDALKEVMGVSSAYCIRCGEPLSERDRDAGNVLCDRDYREWAKYKNPAHPEKFCVSCGQPRKTSYAKPECSSCYREGTSAIRR